MLGVLSCAFLGMVSISHAQQTPADKPDTTLKNYPAFYSHYCDNAVQNSDLVKCLSEHLVYTQDQLNGAYGDTVKALEGEKLDTFRESQKNWISYRDSVCGWESDLGENKQETVLTKACELRLTQRRVDDLRSISDTSYKRREFGLQPRWFSLLGSQHPNILWNLASTQSYDTTCDEIPEALLWGRDLNDFSKDHLAVIHVENSAAPQLHLLQPSHSCPAGYNIEFSRKPSDPETCEIPVISIAGKGADCTLTKYRFDKETKAYIIVE